MNGLVPGHRYTIRQVAKALGLNRQQFRRWLMRAMAAQPEVKAVVKYHGEFAPGTRSGPGGVGKPVGSTNWVIPDVTKLFEYNDFSGMRKRYIREDEAKDIDKKVIDQNRQIKALRARVAACERYCKTIEQLCLQLVKDKTRYLKWEAEDVSGILAVVPEEKDEEEDTG